MKREELISVFINFASRKEDSYNAQRRFRDAHVELCALLEVLAEEFAKNKFAEGKYEVVHGFIVEFDGECCRLAAQYEWLDLDKLFGKDDATA